MAIATQENFTANPSNEVLAKIEKITDTEALQLQTVLDEDLKGYIERKLKYHTGQPVMNAFSESLAEFDSLYTELAK